MSLRDEDFFPGSTMLFFTGSLVLICSFILVFQAMPDSPNNLFFLEGFFNYCSDADHLLMIIAFTTVGLLLFESFFKKSNKNWNKVYVLLALISLLSYFYLAGVVCKSNYVNIWDTYHYFLGAKYFQELGYTRLYECTVIASHEDEDWIPRLERIRDLKTYKTVNYRLAIMESECKKSFSKPRWMQFKTDVAVFRESLKSIWPGVLRDHGYHGTPVHNMFAMSLSNKFELTYRNLVLASLIDMIALVIMFAFVSKSFNPRIGLLFAILFCVNFPSRFVHIGGSFLRYFWLAALIAAFCFMKQKKYLQSGIFMGLSSMLVIFPVLFSVGVGVKAVREYLSKRVLQKEYLDFGKGFTAAMIILYLASLSVGHGFIDWVEFKEQMDLNAYRFSQHRIGMKNLMVQDIQLSNKEKKNAYENKKTSYILMATAAIIITLSLIKRFDELETSIILGMLLLFTLTITVRYYYMVSTLLLFVWHRHMKTKHGLIGVILLFAMMGLLFQANQKVIHEKTYPENSFAENQAYIYNNVSTTLYAVILAATIILKATILTSKSSIQDKLG